MPPNNTIGVWLPTVKVATGADIFTERLASALNQRGIRCEICWLPRKAEFLPWLCKSPLPPKWATVVHTNSWLHRKFIPQKLPVVTTFHSVPQDPLMRPYKSLMQTLYHRYWVDRLERNSHKRADYLTAVSHFGAQQVHKVYGSKEIEAIHNWVDTLIFKPAPHKTKEKVKILYLGSPILRKGVDLLPKIMKRLGDEYHLFYTATPEAIPGYPNLPSNMTSIEKVYGDENLSKLYNKMDILLFPTRSEGFGLVALEAQACGIPVVSTDIPPLTEVVINTKTGLLCRMDDVNAYSDAIKKISETPSVKEKMEKYAVIHASKFSEEAIISKYINIYKTLSHISCI